MKITHLASISTTFFVTSTEHTGRNLCVLLHKLPTPCGIHQWYINKKKIRTSLSFLNKLKRNQFSHSSMNISNKKSKCTYESLISPSGNSTKCCRNQRATHHRNIMYVWIKHKWFLHLRIWRKKKNVWTAIRKSKSGVIRTFKMATSLWRVLILNSGCTISSDT